MNIKAIDIPSELKGDKQATAKWHEVVADLSEAQLLEKIDRHSLCLYCLLWSEYMQVKAAMKREFSIKDKKGSVKRSPLILTAAVLEARLIALLPQLLLTAKSRVRVKDIEYNPNAIEQPYEFKIEEIEK